VVGFTKYCYMLIKSKRVIRVGHVAHMGEMRNAYKTLVGKSEGKTLLGRPRHKWEDNRIILGKIGRKVWSGCIWLRIGTGGSLL